jgi:hypothetical protein
MSKKVRIIISCIMLQSVITLIIVLLVIRPHLPPMVYILLGFFCVMDTLLACIIFASAFSKDQNISTTTQETSGELYSDGLIKIDNDGITIRLFYFPFGSKRINFSDIETVQAYKGGCMRIWGSGDFRTWFGLDFGAMKRTMTFIIYYKNSWFRTGLTAQNSERVAEILKSKNLLQIT